jgi:plasmid stabilization system protein ParE
MKYEVIILPTAERDLNHIITWLFERSPDGAKTWLDRWDELIGSLEQDPLVFPVAPESERHPIPIRQVVFRTRKGNPYRLLFAVEENRVFLIHVRGAGQQPLRSISFP